MRFGSLIFLVDRHIPLGGHLLYSLRRCCVLVMAERTDNLLTRDLILEAVPYSSESILLTREIWSPGGMINEIMEVPFPRAASKFLINFFTLNISICWSNSESPILIDFYFV